MHAYIEHKGKRYSVTFGRRYGAEITHTYEVSCGGFSARKRRTPRTSWVDPDGRLGSAIMRKAAEQVLTTE